MNARSTHLIRQAFGQAVRQLRLRARLSQEQLADKSDLDRTYIGGVERGERNPSLVAITKIASGLNVALSDLFAEYESVVAHKRRRASSNL